MTTHRVRRRWPPLLRPRPRTSKPPRRSRVSVVTLLFAILLAAVGTAVVLSILLTENRIDAEQGETTTAERQRDATAAQAAALATQILAECGTGARSGGVCDMAARVAADPVAGPVGVPGEPGRAPTPDEIRAAVATYLVLNPPPAGRAPTAAEVAAAVTAFLTANPPTPGRPPTAAEIAAAVGMYFDTNPPQSGEDGEPGRPPTAEEIRAAVAAELAANPPPMGAQGVSVQSVGREVRDEQCVLVFVLGNPADGTTSEQVVPVPAPVCDDGGGVLDLDG